MTALMDQHAQEMAELVGTKLDRLFDSPLENVISGYLLLIPTFI